MFYTFSNLNLGHKLPGRALSAQATSVLPNLIREENFTYIAANAGPEASQSLEGALQGKHGGLAGQRHCSMDSGGPRAGGGADLPSWEEGL